MRNKYDNFKKAFSSLEKAVSDPVTENRDIAGIIKNFEFVYELSWTTLKEMLAIDGHPTSSARNVYQKAFQLNIIDDQDVWLSMIADRNLAVHTYNEDLANEMVMRIKSSYLSSFLKLDIVFRNELALK